MSSRNPYAWPDGWSREPRYVNLFAALAFNYGKERADKIVCGEDEPTNADLRAWRRVLVAR